MNICRDCKHARRGRAIDVRPRMDDVPPPPTRPRMRGGDYICSARGAGITQTPIDPVDGSGGCDQGPDCRDLNPAGECTDFERGAMPIDHVLFGVAVLGFIATLIIAAVTMSGAAP